MRAASQSGRWARLPFGPNTDGPVALAVDFTRQALAEWHLLSPRPGRPHLAEDVVLIVGELVSNACRHGRGPRELVLEHRPDALHITVSDHSPDQPHRRVHTPGEPDGYGLVILDKIASRWGTSPAGDGKAVWAQLAIGRERRR